MAGLRHLLPATWAPSPAACLPPSFPQGSDLLTPVASLALQKIAPTPPARPPLSHLAPEMACTSLCLWPPRGQEGLQLAPCRSQYQNRV